MLVACDPGLRHVGLALFDGATLRQALLIRNPEKKVRGPQAWWAMAEAVDRTIFVIPTQYVLEVPQVYRGRRTDPDDLLQLAGVGGAIGAILKAPKATGYYPRQWKGQVNPDVMLQRIESRLSEKELAAIEPCAASLRHNVLDAIGLGLYHLGRLSGGA